jgi:O-antigen/teichoic acid export membrane protein
MNLGASIRHNTLWILTGTLAGRLLGFAVGIVLARLLAPADFGMLVTVQVFTGVAGYFATGGMSEALVQARAVNERDYRVVFTAQLAICLLIYTGFWLGAPLLARTFDNPLYADLLRVSALSFLMRPFANIPRARLKRAMRFKQIAINRFIALVVTGAASITLALLTPGPWALVLGGLAGTLIHVLQLYAVTRWRPGLAFEREALQRLGRYGFRTSANELIRYLREQTSNLIISRLLGPAQVGLYNKADSLAALPAQTIGGAVYGTVFRALAKTQDSQGQSHYIYFRTLTLLAVYTFPVYVTLLFLAEPFIVTVYGAPWRPSATPLQVLCLIGLMRCVSYPSGALVAAHNRLARETPIQIQAWLITAAGAFIGAQWGINGAAWGVLPGYAYLTLRLFRLAQSCVKGRPRELAGALTPALLLSLPLLLFFLAARLLWPDATSRHPAGSLLLMGSVAGLGYCLLFLYLPIPALAAEALRWKRQLHLTRQ